MKERLFKNIIIIFLLFIFLITSVYAAYALDYYALMCLRRGEMINFTKCKLSMSPLVCNFADKCYQCTLIREDGTMCIAGPNSCGSIADQCTYLNNGGGIVPLPLELTVSSPSEGSVYNSRYVNFEVNTTDFSKITVKNNLNPYSGEQVLCTSCKYSKKVISLREGFNSITIRALTRSGQADSEDLSFVVDSIRPIISKTAPTKGFASGEFSVEFKESNPESIALYYGVAGNYKATSVDYNTDCTTLRGITKCTANVDIIEFDGSTISYWFEVEDIAQTKVSSRPYSLKVDISAPNFLSSNIFSLGSYINFKFKINESNFLISEYKEGTRWLPICRRLTIDGNCTGRVKFREGFHTLQIRARDRAGNENSIPSVTVLVDSIKPRIISTLPTSSSSSGTASGLFTLKFKETNPSTAKLIYGKDGINKEISIDLNSECTIDLMRVITCTKNIDLTEYVGSTIRYWFEVVDAAANLAKSSTISLNVASV